MLLDDLRDIACDSDCGTHRDRSSPGPSRLARWAIEEEGTVAGYFVIKAAKPPETLATGVGYWTAAEARGRGIASRCVETATEWLFGGQDIMPADEVELLHTVGNEGSCRVAQKCGYVLESVIPPLPPRFPEEGHRHLRKRPA
jgi:RimJ/RimL family protein N-acetyltransferase